METLEVLVPETMIGRMRERAGRSHRTVEEELIQLAGDSLANEDRLRPELRSMMDALASATSDELRSLAARPLAPAISDRIARLNFQQSEGDLNGVERIELDQLMREYERALLAGARVAQLLHQRGEPLPSPFQP